MVEQRLRVAEEDGVQKHTDALLQDNHLVERAQLRKPLSERLASVLTTKNKYVRCFLAEFLGTFILVAIGDGCVAQLVLSRGRNANIVTIEIGWGLAVMFGVFVSMGTSGGHINPAVTLVMALLKNLSWSLVPVYMLAQYLGAFAAAIAIYIVYNDSLSDHEVSCSNVSSRPVAGACGTAGIWATYPKPHVTDAQGFADQVFATGLLVLLALAVTDKRNIKVPDFAIPPCIGLIVTAILCAYELNCGGALNPARDLAPRIFTAMAGWGVDVFTHPTSTWFLVPVFGPHIGALWGAAMYKLCISLHNGPEATTTANENGHAIKKNTEV